MGADPSLLEIEQRMLRDMPDWLEQLAAVAGLSPALESPGWAECRDSVRMLAHRIRGRAAMLGMRSLAEAAGRLESSAVWATSRDELQEGVGLCVAALGIGPRAGSTSVP
jgi:HPt (histidine-containing phosphotransfer) domain-containing protein